MILLVALYIYTALVFATASDLQFQACLVHLLALGLAEAAVFAICDRAATERPRSLLEAWGGAFNAGMMISPAVLSRGSGEALAVSNEPRSFKTRFYATNMDALALIEDALGARALLSESSRTPNNHGGGRCLTAIGGHNQLPSDLSSTLFFEGIQP